jgi:tetratricopeptide (TPR) repeat protein
MTDEARLNRIREIFDVLQDRDPRETVGQRIGLCSEALGLMTPDELTSQVAGWLELEMGKAHVRRLGQDRFEDLSTAIRSFTAALTIWTPESQPVNWVAAQTNLGVAYSDRHALTGNLEDERRALDAYQAALRIVNLDDDPATWGQLKNNVGVLHLQRSEGDRAQIIEAALESLQEAALIRSRLGLRREWAETQVNLGTAYRERVVGDRSENLESSLACFEVALSAVGEETDTLLLGLIYIELSKTLRYRIAGNWADNLERAYASAQQATSLIQPAQDPLAWADAQRELGNALRRRVTGSRAENLETAITCYRRALSRYSRDTAPQKWALASAGLGRALIERIRGQRVTNLEEALEHLQGAVAALSGSASSMVLYAAVLSELGSVYLWRRRGSKADNAENAWRHLSEARQLMERLGLPPLTRSAVINGLGNAYMERVPGERGRHVEDAIECYQLALELAGSEEGQLQARLLNNLATAYAQRVHGDRAGNLARALQLYEQVTSFRTREVSPFEWAETRINAGTALIDNLDLADPALWHQASLAYRDAIGILHPGGPTASVITAGRNLGRLGALTRHWPDATEGYQIALAAANARYRESLQLEARYDELTDMTGLRAELAAALCLQSQDAVDLTESGSPIQGRLGGVANANALLKRAVTVIEDGRMQMLGDLMERDRAQLTRLRAEHPDLYESYLVKAEELREYQSQQWQEFH